METRSGMTEVYTTGGYTGKRRREGLLTGLLNPSTGITRPQTLKVVPPLVQKVGKLLLWEAGRVCDRKQHSIFSNFYSFSLKIGYFLLLRAAGSRATRGKQLLVLPQVVQTPFLAGCAQILNTRSNQTLAKDWENSEATSPCAVSRCNFC